MCKVPWFLPVLCGNQVCGLWTMVRCPHTCYLYWFRVAVNSLVKRKQLPTQSAVWIIASLFMSLHLKLSFNVSRARVLSDWQMFKGAYCGPLFMEITDMGHALVLFLFCQCLPVFLFTIIPHPGRPALLTGESCFLISNLYFSRLPGVDVPYLSNMLSVHLHWDGCQPFWELCIAQVKPASFFFYLFYFTWGVSSLKLRETLLYSCQSV